MKIDMTESVSPLVDVQWEPYLDLIQEVIKKHPLISATNTTIELASATIAQEVVRQVTQRNGTRNELPALFSYTMGTRMASAHLDGPQAHDTFAKKIDALSETIQRKLVQTITDATITSATAYIDSFPFDMTLLQNKVPKGLHYPFTNPQPLKKRRAHLRSHSTLPVASQVRYRGHKLSMTLEGIDQFDDELIKGLCTLFQGTNATVREIEDVRTILERRKQDPTSELMSLKNIIKEETLGKIKLESCFLFASELYKLMGQDASLKQNANKFAGLQELQRQEQMLNHFRHFLADPRLSDSDYQVNYADEHINIRSFFARSDAYDILPIFTEIAGTLGEVLDLTKDEQTFTCSLRLKLNGKVGKIRSVFRYNAMLLDPENAEHKERLSSPFWNQRRFVEKVFQILFLYNAVFLMPNNYEQFFLEMQDLFTQLKNNERGTKIFLHEKAQSLFSLTAKTNNLNQYELRLEQARNVLESYLKNVTSGSLRISKYWYLLLHNGMLHQNLDRMLLQKRFFQPDIFSDEEHRKDALKYITVQESTADQDAFYALPVRVEIEPIYIAEVEEVEEASMAFAINGWKMLPIIMAPDASQARALVSQTYRPYRYIFVPYKDQITYRPDAFETSLYRQLFALVTYLCLDWFRQITTKSLHEQNSLFLPIIRVHAHEQETGKEQARLPNEDRVVRGICKTLTHLFSAEKKTLSNTQGFAFDALGPQGDQYKISNGLSSLYNILPRLITPPTGTSYALDKLALIVISHRKGDIHSKTTLHEGCVYGEILECSRLPDKKIRIEQISTFSLNEKSENLYTTPITLIDAVRRCYIDGYRHIFYVAKAPYTSYVHFTGKLENDELFFMSPAIIQGVLEVFPDIFLYPMFCDRYYMNRVNALAQPESLYIDDTSELRALMADPNKSTVVFWNVLNGILVTPRKSDQGHHYYNGIASYSTLINMYDNPLCDQAIRNNLLDNRQPDSLRRDMLDFLSYVHSVRFERRAKDGVQFKLDPYEAIIGYDSVGTRSIIPSTDFRARTNLLSFLTLVRSIIRRRRSRKFLNRTTRQTATHAPSTLEIQKEDKTNNV